MSWVKGEAVRERAGVVGKTRGLRGENRSITNFSGELHSHSFPIKPGWRESSGLALPHPPLPHYLYSIAFYALWKRAVVCVCVCSSLPAL